MLLYQGNHLPYCAYMHQAQLCTQAASIMTQAC
jgi:hypothetical protein